MMKPAITPETRPPPTPNLWKNVRPPLVTSLVTTFNSHGDVNASPKSWWTPTSYDPPLLVVSCQPDSDTVRNIEENGHFVLHIPQGSPRGFATKVLHTAKPLPYGENELDDVGLAWRWMTHPDWPQLEYPVVEGVPFFACMTMSRIPAGDHVMYEGQVVMAGDLGEVGVTDVLLHRGQNTFVEVGPEWKAERY